MCIKLNKKPKLNVAQYQGEQRAMNQSNHTTPEEDFIDLVQKEKALWDPSHHHYKDVETKTKIWRTLAELCNSTGKIRIYTMNGIYLWSLPFGPNLKYASVGVFI